MYYDRKEEKKTMQKDERRTCIQASIQRAHPCNIDNRAAQSMRNLQAAITRHV
jgi:hypothetical protein